MEIEFEWDERKAARNLAKHGVPFEYVTRVFLDVHRVDGEDARHEYRETRRVTQGFIEGRLYVVAYTLRGSVVRLISARKANHRERKCHDETLQTKS